VAAVTVWTHSRISSINVMITSPRLQRVQNAAVRLVLGLDQRSYITSTLTTPLLWVKYRITFSCYGNTKHFSLPLSTIPHLGLKQLFRHHEAEMKLSGMPNRLLFTIIEPQVKSSQVEPAQTGRMEQGFRHPSRRAGVLMGKWQIGVLCILRGVGQL